MSYSKTRSLLESIFALLSKNTIKFSKDDHNSFKDYRNTICLLREITLESFFTQSVLSLLQKFDDNLRVLIQSQHNWFRFLTTNRARGKLDSIHVSLALETSRFLLTQSAKTSTTVVSKSWASLFGGALAVPWEQFITQIKATESLSVNDEKILKYLVDPTKVGMVIPSRFSELLESFGSTLSECIYNISQLGKRPWFYGFMTIDESKRFLEEEEVGTFLVRFSGTKPGAFTIDYVAYVEDDMKSRFEEDQGHLYGSLIRSSPKAKSTKKKEVLSLRVENVHGRFHMKEADAHSAKTERTLVFPSIDKVVAYAPDQFKQPMTSTLARLPWFYGSMEAPEAQDLLQGRTTGTFLLRFSSKNDCIVVVTFIDEKSSVSHARVIRVPKGVKIDGNQTPTFPNLDALLAHYMQQQKLTHPLVERDLSLSSSSSSSSISPSSSPAMLRQSTQTDEEEEWDPVCDFATVKYQEGRVLGRGAYGMVNICKVIKTGCICAMKKFSFPEDLPEDKQQALLKSFMNELELMKKLRHKNIIRVLGAKTDTTSMMIFMELLDCSLAAVLKKKLTAKHRRGSAWYSLEELKRYALQIAEGLNFLHANSIVHRDLKPENVLVSLKHLNTIHTLKITDFGVSKQVDQMQPNACTIIGTTEFMAPEVFEKNYSYPADIWSYGMVLYSLLTGKNPQFNLRQLAKSERAPLSKEVQSEYPFLAAIFGQCTNLEPSQRPTAPKLLEQLGSPLKLSFSKGRDPDNNNH